MASILIIYASTDGQTARICRRLQEVIEQAGDTVTLRPITETAGLDLQP